MMRTLQAACRVRRRRAGRPRRAQRKSRMTQLFTSDIGHPHVEKLVAVDTALFRISGNRNDFWRAYAKAFPKPGDQLELDIRDENN